MIVYDYIFDILKENGLNVFAPNSHKGECIENYVVVKETSANQYNNYSSQIIFYDIMCYAKIYTDCLKLKEQVGKIMQKAKFTIMPTGVETDAYFDDHVKGFMTSIEYRNYRKMQ